MISILGSLNDVNNCILYPLFSKNAFIDSKIGFIDCWSHRSASSIDKYRFNFDAAICIEPLLLKSI